MRVWARPTLPGSLPPFTNPPGVLQLVTSGPYHLRVWNIQGDNPIKSAQIIHEEHENFVDHCWLTLDSGVQRLAVFTEGGTALNSNQRFGSILLCQSIDEDKLIEYRRTKTVVLQGNKSRRLTSRREGLHRGRNQRFLLRLREV
jgi:hypothetical protein